MIGRTPPTLRRWRRDGIHVPTVVLWQFDLTSEGEPEGLRIPLWTPEDVERGQELAATIKPGPEPVRA
jgi:hypothetical protein